MTKISLSLSLSLSLTHTLCSRGAKSLSISLSVYPYVIPPPFFFILLFCSPIFLSLSLWFLEFKLTFTLPFLSYKKKKRVLMDSGNSGSLQSSSGDEEFDSRADAISAAAIRNNQRGAPTHIGPISNQPPPPPLSSAMFDPLSSSFFDPMSRPPQQQLPFHHHSNNSNSLLNLDMAAWSKTLRSDPNCTEINTNSALLPSSSSLQSLFVAHQGQLQNPAAVPIPPPVVVPENSTSATNTPTRAAAAAPDHQPQPHAPRNPKKRSRASRRAPTTVLTTDTTNFRAMVQEFTGIPAPPFTASSPFPRARVLDLYGTPSSMRSNHHPLDSSGTSQPSYLRRPFPQKVQLPPPPFLASSSSSSSSSVIDHHHHHHAIVSSNANNLTSGLSPPNATASPLFNYQLSPQSSSLFNVPNPIFTSLLQSNPAKASPLEIPSNDSRLKISFLDDFGLGHGGSVNPTTTTATTTTTLSGLPGLISTDQTVPRNNSNENPPSISWGNGIGAIHENDRECQVVRNASHGKLNFSTSTSGFPSDKGSDNAAAAGGGGRGEGMMESWICSSD